LKEMLKEAVDENKVLKRENVQLKRDEQKHMKAIRELTHLVTVRFRSDTYPLYRSSE
jgi:hypothetical protein